MMVGHFFKVWWSLRDLYYFQLTLVSTFFGINSIGRGVLFWKYSLILSNLYCLTIPMPYPCSLWFSQCETLSYLVCEFLGAEVSVSAMVLLALLSFALPETLTACREQKPRRGEDWKNSARAGIWSQVP